ncbi:proteasome-type protease [Pseudoduganella umbonata]|uniref:Peptidase n=1 Tax=Pseudoduganella umbonata TaxID=864828 RepID=A0A4P8HLH5_9BURK|nr:proteasome-type protease [Pseudoduganella umbonata]MBB3219729.1 putative proteasome-type protease [Pseudoduganella umbonata]QCP09776.1 peptidase [Pseudoduganella umbonata]
MTYCVAMRLDAGLVFLSDSRTNAGVDQIGTFRKMTVFENPGDRTMVLMTAGNLSISQSVLQLLHDHVGSNGTTIWTAPDMYEAARIVGEAVRAIHVREAKALAQFNIEFNVSIIFGGQIRGETCRLFQIYAAGNFIEAHDENTYFQIGEAKYGKPIIDRVVTRRSSLDDAVKCALISMDSTLRSNISVGLPLDLLVYEADSLAVTRFVTIDEKNAYFQMLRGTWGAQLRQVFEGIDAPTWQPMPDADDQPVRMPLPAAVPPVLAPPVLQSMAQQSGDGK